MTHKVPQTEDGETAEKASQSEWKTSFDQDRRDQLTKKWSQQLGQPRNTDREPGMG